MNKTLFSTLYKGKDIPLLEHLKWEYVAEGGFENMITAYTLDCRIKELLQNS